MPRERRLGHCGSRVYAPTDAALEPCAGAQTHLAREGTLPQPERMTVNVPIEEAGRAAVPHVTGATDRASCVANACAMLITA